MQALTTLSSNNSKQSLKGSPDSPTLHLVVVPEVMSIAAWSVLTSQPLTCSDVRKKPSNLVGKTYKVHVHAKA